MFSKKLAKSNFQPVFIIGAARSGTNMLRDLINKIPECSTWDCDEINPIWKHGNLKHDHDAFTSEMAIPKVTKFIKKEFEKIAKKYESQIVVEKTCANSVRVPFINEIFPNAKYIFIYRNVFDAVASSILRYRAPFDLMYTLKKIRYVPIMDLPFYIKKFALNRLKQMLNVDNKLKFWGVQTRNIKSLQKKTSLIEICTLQWKECVQSSNLALDKINKNQVLKIKYEKFVEDPHFYFKEILKFINVSMSDHLINESVLDVSKKSVGKYKNQLNKDEIDKIRIIAKNEINLLGY